MDRRSDLYRVVDDWDEPLPITDEELQLLEFHLGELIATMAEID